MRYQSLLLAAVSVAAQSTTDASASSETSTSPATTTLATTTAAGNGSSTIDIIFPWNEQYFGIPPPPAIAAPSGIVISIIAANPCNTTYALDLPSSAYGPGNAVVSRNVTAAATTQINTAATTISGFKWSEIVNCKIYPSSSAICTTQYTNKISGSYATVTRTTGAVTNTYTSGEYLATASITAGGSLLDAVAGQTCTKKSTGGAAAPTNIAEVVYKVIVPVGVVAAGVLL